MLGPEFQGHQAKGERICWSKGRVTPPLGSFRIGGSLVEAPALGPVFSPVANFLNSPELGPRESTGAILPLPWRPPYHVWCQGLTPSLSPAWSYPCVAPSGPARTRALCRVHDLGPVLLVGMEGGCPSGKRRSLRRMKEAVEDVRCGESIWQTRVLHFPWSLRSGAWARGGLKEGVGVGWGVEGGG